MVLDLPLPKTYSWPTGTSVGMWTLDSADLALLRHVELQQPWLLMPYPRRYSLCKLLLLLHQPHSCHANLVRDVRAAGEQEEVHPRSSPSVVAVELLLSLVVVVVLVLVE